MGRRRTHNDVREETKEKKDDVGCRSPPRADNLNVSRRSRGVELEFGGEHGKEEHLEDAFCQELIAQSTQKRTQGHGRARRARDPPARMLLQSKHCGRRGVGQPAETARGGKEARERVGREGGGDSLSP